MYDISRYISRVFSTSFRKLLSEMKFSPKFQLLENVKSIDPIVCETHQTEKIEVRLTEILLLQYKKWICAVENDSLPPFYPPFYAFYWQFYFTTEIENLKPFLFFQKNTTYFRLVLGSSRIWYTI